MSVYYKTNLIQDYAEQANITKAEAERRINAVFNIIGDKLAEMGDGDSVMLAGYFNHHVRVRRAKPANNPQTGAPMVIGETKTIVSKPSKPLRSKIRGVTDKPLLSVEE